MLTRLFLGIVLLVPSAAFAQGSFSDHCANGSPLPFAAIEVKQPIDKSCGAEGKSTAAANSHLQNQAKNNFCATVPGGQPETITPQNLVDLQARTTVPSGQGKEPTDRKPLQNLGEGKLVRMTAFLFEAHYADLGSGETVNCNGATAAENDVHIALVSQADAKECDSVTAEISPHYRPASWAQIGNFETYNSKTKKYTPNPAMAAPATGSAVPHHGATLLRRLPRTVPLHHVLHAVASLGLGDPSRLQHRSVQGRDRLRPKYRQRLARL